MLAYTKYQSLASSDKSAPARYGKLLKGQEAAF